MPEAIDGQQTQSFRLGVPERTGLVVAAMSLPPSLQRGLLPRSMIQQAGLSGFMGAINYATATTVESAIESIAHRVVGGTDTPTRRSVTLAANVTTVALGIGIQRLLTQQPGEPIRRAAARSVAWRVSMAAAVGSVVVTADELGNRLGRGRATLELPMTLTAGAGITAGLYGWHRKRLREAGVEADALGQPVDQPVPRAAAEAMAVGAAITTGLYLGAQAESIAASGIGHVVGFVVPGLAPVQKAIGHAAMFGLLGFAGVQALNRVDRMTENAGTAVEPAYAAELTAPTVTGGPNSLIEASTIGREGRRFVNMTLTADEITAVMGEPAVEPIRAFVGLDTVGSAVERADLAIRELEALGGLDRPTHALFSPTGTGYVNYVACESLEYMTRGNVASVALQYSVRPSFLSLDRVSVGRENTVAFLTALKWRLAAMPKNKRPRVVMFGESLGSHVGESSLARTSGYGHEFFGIDRALFIGSPWGSAWRRRWLADPDTVDPDRRVVEVSGYDEWLALDDESRGRARIVLLTHHDDPIPKFGPTLAIQAPDWMGPADTRPPGVPTETHWRSIATFIVTFLDLLNADQGSPGSFEARGHDYKADLAQFTRLAWDLFATPEQLDAVERALRTRELKWAKRRISAEAAAQSEAKVRETLQKWGVDAGSIPPLITPTASGTQDKYAADADLVTESA
jgi:uncharacterized membrane protein